MTEIRVIIPFAVIANVSTNLTPDQKKVNWSTKSKIIFPMNIMMPIIEKMLTKDMDTSLQKLKVILEE